MVTDKEIKKNILSFSAFAGVGFIALFLGYVLKFQPHAMSGIAIGFIPVGVIGALIYALGDKEKMIKQIKIEKEERNTFISNKAGNTAFWITFYFVFALTIASSFLNVSANTLIIATLIFMPIVYFTLLIIYHYRY